jgi:hypothetical protein
LPVSFRLSPPKFCVLFPCSHKCHMPLLLNSPFGYYSCSLKDKAVCACAIRKYGGIGGITLLFLNLDTRLRRVVSFAHRSLYPQERIPVSIE